MSAEDCELLGAMGLTDRCRLRICRVGEPCIIQVAATRLGLSRVMAGKIMVQPDPRTPDPRTPDPRMPDGAAT
jgi:hypothetical protein